MIEHRIIVFIASDWDYDPTGKHHLARQLAKHNDIVWVNFRGSRKPTLSRYDVAAAWGALKRVATGVRPAADNICQLTPLVIPGATRPGMEKISAQLLIAQIKRAIRTCPNHKGKPVQIWSFAPDVPYLQGALGEELFLYYCVDEFAEFDGFDADRIRRAETEQIRRADLVVTTSQALLESKRKIRSDVTLVPHGVDIDHFAAAWREKLETPTDIAEIPKPIFGFFGLIHHWVDLELLAAVARRRPFYSFVLLGEVKVDTSAIAGLDNIHLLGRKQHSELPAYCAAFDAGLMFFKRTSMTRHVNPIKLPEYLAAGLPVISAPLAEAERFRGPVTIADSPDAFAEACDQIALAEQPGTRREIAASVANETWESKAEKLSALVLEKIGAATEPKQAPANSVLHAGNEQPTATTPLTAS